MDFNNRCFAENLEKDFLNVAEVIDCGFGTIDVLCLKFGNDF